MQVSIKYRPTRNQIYDSAKSRRNIHLIWFRQLNGKSNFPSRNYIVMSEYFLAAPAPADRFSILPNICANVSRPWIKHAISGSRRSIHSRTEAALFRNRSRVLLALSSWDNDNIFINGFSLIIGKDVKSRKESGHHTLFSYVLHNFKTAISVCASITRWLEYKRMCVGYKTK